MDISFYSSGSLDTDINHELDIEFGILKNC